MLLSIGLMVKNEEKYLDRCLKSLQMILDNLDSELIIVDTGSTDNTINIAKKYTSRVYSHKWNNDFSEIRNIILDYCKGEWFFFIDGDQVLEDCTELINFFVNNTYKKYKSATINIKELEDSNNEDLFSISVGARLFLKDNDFKFVNAIHEQPLLKDPIKNLNVFCKHYGYINNDVDALKNKSNRNIEILEKELEKKPNDIYFLYQLALSYGLIKNYSKALNYIIKAYNLTQSKTDKLNYIYVYQTLSVLYFNLKDYSKLENYSTELLKYNADIMDSYYFLGVAQKELKKDTEAISSFRSYLNLYNSFAHQEKDLSITYYTLDNLDDAYYHLFELLKNTDYNSAKEYLLKIKSIKYSDELINSKFIELIKGSRQYDDLKEYEEMLIINNQINKLDIFYGNLEELKKDLDKKDIDYIENLFSEGNTPYNTLNKMRQSYKKINTTNLNKYKAVFSKINLGNKPYYSDLIYYFLIDMQDLSLILSNVSFREINHFLNNINSKYENLDITLYDYVAKFKNNNKFLSIRLNKQILHHLIISNKLNKTELEEIYNLYIKFSLKYVSIVYNEYVLNNELLGDLKDKEEILIIFLNKAFKYKENNLKLYIKYLKKIIEIYPQMKFFINYLLDKINNNSENTSLENKILMKNQINENLESNNLIEAENLINSYAEKYFNDIEIYSFMGILSILKNDFKSAENILRDGLKFDRDNFDLNYNLGFVYENLNENGLAVKYYGIALVNASSEDMNVQIKDLLKSLL
ncbi:MULTISPECIES: glycosyltransferase [unclassified Clostridium]|uniref:glycosyltransferase n=1 Tax=unclassified Clostridium TaxID=2614128 RepID=UPI000297D239|nr:MULTISPECIES: glycosyltransferase [unclassified Clostridium]EKQ51103.1 MAG: glycosyl transferase [Clostridium sp. Maddingley MBC34-26]